MYNKIDFLPDPLEEIWVITRDGIPIVEYCQVERDQLLMGSLLAALKSFCLESTGTNLDSFSLGNNKFTSINCANDKLIIFCKTSQKAKDKKIRNLCKAIALIFDEVIPPEAIINWDGELSVFDEFKNRLELYFKLSNV